MSDCPLDAVQPEEARGLVRWLRPDYQNPAGRAVAAKADQGALDIGPTESTIKCDIFLLIAMPLPVILRQRSRRLVREAH